MGKVNFLNQTESFMSVKYIFKCMVMQIKKREN